MLDRRRYFADFVASNVHDCQVWHTYAENLIDVFHPVHLQVNELKVVNQFFLRLMAIDIIGVCHELVETSMVLLFLVVVIRESI
jgi:hypothetical protein